MPGRAARGVAVVTPAYQAAATVAAVVSRTSRAVPGATVYVVDDGSTDGTHGAGRGNGATLLVHPRNRGKGVALATGIAAALDGRSEEHTSELQSQSNLVCRLLLEKKKKKQTVD